jgi:tetratricopeptide (TPR) repeat protein
MDKGFKPTHAYNIYCVANKNTPMSQFVDALSRAEEMSCGFDTSSDPYDPEDALRVAEATLAAAKDLDDADFEENSMRALMSSLRVVNAACPANYQTIVEDGAISHDLYVRALCVAGDVYMAASDRMMHWAYSPAVNTARLQLLNKYAEYYTTALHSAPYDVELKRHVSTFHLSFARTAAHTSITHALEHAQTALLHHPEDPAVHLALGEFYHQLEQPAVALMHLKLCAALTSADCNASPLSKKDLEKSWILAHQRIAVIYRELRQYALGIHYAKAGLSMNRAQPDVLNILGILYTDLAIFDLAQPYFETALANAADSYDVGGPKK